MPARVGDAFDISWPKRKLSPDPLAPQGFAIGSARALPCAAAAAARAGPVLFAHQRPFWPPWRRLFAQPVETIDGMLCDMLAAIERKNCEHRRGIWQCGFRAIRSRGGAPLSPVTFSVVACPPGK